MASWKQRINIKQHLNEDAPLEKVKAGLVAEIEKLKGFEWDYELLDILSDIRSSDTVSEFDSSLEWFYDWADSNSVWLGI